MRVDTRIAVIGIIVEDKSSADGVNGLLHQYGAYIIGRMGPVSYTHLRELTARLEKLEAGEALQERRAEK